MGKERVKERACDCINTFVAASLRGRIGKEHVKMSTSAELCCASTYSVEFVETMPMCNKTQKNIM